MNLGIELLSSDYDNNNSLILAKKKSAMIHTFMYLPAYYDSSVLNKQSIACLRAVDFSEMV